ncbi:two-component regulator propeller domain-containing protein [Marinoscillum sp.]|uniref:sensor histidine kinase n=1 Tax=Marinoscillum sp. TaxID=2024838 RepID=UPI003BAD96F8
MWLHLSPKNILPLVAANSKVVKHVFFLSLLVLLPFTVLSQDIRLDINKNPSQYVLRSWSTEQGMASESTNEIMQSDDGYIWIATYAGLHRFDGKEFTIFNGSNSNIPSPTVLRVKQGINGEIWVGSQHGVSIYNSGEFIIPPKLESTLDMSIEQMLVASNGDLWFSTRTNDLFRYRNQELKEFTTDFDLSESTVLSMVESDDGSIYFGTDDSRLFYYTIDDELKFIPIETNVNGINTLYAQNNTIYVGTGRGLYVWNGEKIIQHLPISDRAIRAVHVDQSDVIWLGTMSGLFRWNPEKAKLDSLTETSGMPNNNVRDMLVDQTGNLWVATYRNGLFFLSDGSIVSYSKEEGTSTSIIANITQIGDDAYLLGNENSSLDLLKDGVISPYKPPIPMPTARLKHLFTDSQGRVWVSTYGGLYVLDGKNSRKYAVSNGFPDNFIRVSFEDSKGNVWVGTKNAGLIRFTNPDDWQQISNENGLSSNYIMSIEENSKGQIIVGTIGGLNIIDENDQIRYFTVDDGLPASFMFSTYSTDKYIWITSNDGLTGYSPEKVVNFNRENGLGVNIVYDILKDDDGNFWLPSDNSILSVNIAELEAAAEDPNKSFKVRQFDKSYGMKNSHCLGAALSLRDSNGTLWIPTLDGIVNLDPQTINTPIFEPNLIIENVIADNIKLDPESQIIVPSGTDRLLIDFTAISYLHTDRLQFRYRLDPFDQEWIVASNERNAVYTNLPPGSYTFQLQTGIDGAFTSEILKKKLTLEAAWWQTFWAKILFGLAIVVTAVLVYWIRLRTLTSRNIWLEKTVSERTKALELQKQELNEVIKQLKNAQEQMIQSDKMASLGILSAGVAHEINNPLNFIQGGVEGLEQMLKNSSTKTEEEYSLLIGVIKEGVSRASKIVSSLNEFSHSVDEKDVPCNVHHIIKNCLVMIQFQLKEGIELIEDFTEEELMVIGNSGKIHQAFLNILTNSVQAIKKDGFIKIKTWTRKNKVIIEITDSGQGIPAEDLPKITEPFFSTKDPGKGTGLGLSITYSIITNHKGQLNYSSTVGKGTTARITLPLMKA